MLARTDGERERERQHVAVNARGQKRTRNRDGSRTDCVKSPSTRCVRVRVFAHAPVSVLVCVHDGGSERHRCEGSETRISSERCRLNWDQREVVMSGSLRLPLCAYIKAAWLWRRFT